MKKILLSLLTVGAVGALAFGASQAFFSDTETSTGNTFTAGKLDLGIDNESFYNGLPNSGTSWAVSYDLSNGNGPANGAYLFYNFNDVKPGDFGEDTISVVVNDNDAWACTSTTVTSDDDFTCTEPELDVDPGCTNPGLDTGELAGEIEIMWWADDGDNVLEVSENVIDGPGDLGSAPLDLGVIRKLADSQGSIFSPTPAPLTGGTKYYIAKAWCFGDLGQAPLAQLVYTGPDDPVNDLVNTGGPATPEDGGFTCNGGVVTSNASQSDQVKLDVSFWAEQWRNNPTFTCAD